MNIEHISFIVIIFFFFTLILSLMGRLYTTFSPSLISQNLLISQCPRSGLSNYIFILLCQHSCLLLSVKTMVVWSWRYKLIIMMMMILMAFERCSQENIHYLFGAVIYFNRHTLLNFSLIKCRTQNITKNIIWRISWFFCCCWKNVFSSSLFYHFCSACLLEAGYIWHKWQRSFKPTDKLTGNVDKYI